jgi:dienelactone hydrolase
MSRQLALGSLLGLLLALPARAASPALWGGLEPGAYDVGFTVLHLIDESRPYGSSAVRPLDVSLWYPVLKGESAESRHVLPFSDYVDLYAGSAERYRRESFAQDPETAVQRLLATPTFAVRDAAPAAGPFPLVVYAPGHAGTPLTHTPTAEYLASHGYAVAIVPSQGDASTGMTFDVYGQEQQVRDIEVALGALRNRSSVDRSRINLVGYSFGGGSVLVAAMRVPGIRAVVSLDGTVAWDHTAQIVSGATGYEPGRFRSPLLVVKSDDDAGEDLSLVRSLALSDRWVVRFKNAQHHDFIASPVLQSVVRGSAGSTIYPAVARLVLRFLDQPQPGPTQVGSSEERLPKVAAPGREELLAAALEQGDVGKLLSAQRAMSQQAPGMALLSAGTLHMLGLQFIDRGQRDKATRIYELLVDLFPRDVFALNVLGDLYRRNNEPAKAAERYRQILAVKPGNGGAVRGLRALATKAPAGGT